jgi:hypothetical protein
LEDRTVGQIGSPVELKKLILPQEHLLLFVLKSQTFLHCELSESHVLILLHSTPFHILHISNLLQLNLKLDSSALSLLMDNKGVNPLDVSITAPDYVTIAEHTVHVEANDHNEV